MNIIKNNCMKGGIEMSNTSINGLEVEANAFLWTIIFVIILLPLIYFFARRIKS